MSDPAEARYLAWKKNSQHLYDTLFVYELPWPSESVAWIPELVTKTNTHTDETQGTTKQRLVLTMNTGDQFPEQLRVLELTCPPIASPETLGALDSEPGTLGGYQPAYACDLHVSQLITAKGVIQQARIIPQNPNLVATVAQSGDCAMFDLTKFPTRPMKFYSATMTLKGHNGTSTMSLDCSPVQEGLIATGDANGDVLVYDLESAYNSRDSSMDPVLKASHEAQKAVNDVKWHPKRPAVLATCGDDGYVHLRSTVGKTGADILRLSMAEHTENGLKKLPTALAWNPVNESLLAVGFDTGEVELWDVRSSGVKLFSFAGHQDYVTRLVWNTWHPGMLASGSADATTKIWNAAQLQSDPVFTHGGHRAPVTDVQWNPAIPQMLASVSEDNGFHVYAPSDDLLGF